MKKELFLLFSGFILFITSGILFIPFAFAVIQESYILWTVAIIITLVVLTFVCVKLNRWEKKLGFVEN